MSQATFVLSNVVKSFSGIKAVQDFSLEVHRGELHGLIGPNGAGKTTVVNVAAGVYPPDEGEVYLSGRGITRLATYQRARLGLGRTFQSARLFEQMTVRENIRVALGIKKHQGKAPEANIERLLEDIGIADAADTLCADLPHGRRKLVEVARAMQQSPRALLLDEPAAGLHEEEIEILVEFIESYRKEVAVLLIEHNMDVVMRLCDPITVMDAGRRLATGAPDEVTREPAVIEAYLGVT